MQYYFIFFVSNILFCCFFFFFPFILVLFVANRSSCNGFSSFISLFKKIKIIACKFSSKIRFPCVCVCVFFFCSNSKNQNNQIILKFTIFLILIKNNQTIPKLKKNSILFLIYYHINYFQKLK